MVMVDTEKACVVTAVGRARSFVDVDLDQESGADPREPKLRREMMLPYTQIPNLLLDGVLPLVPGTYFCALLFFWRRIVGWHKKSDQISVGQLQ